MKEEWTNRLNDLQKEGKWKLAQKMIVEQSLTNPSSAQEFFDRGLAFGCKGNLEAALGDFKKCVELEPQDYEANLRLGWTLSSLERYEEALEVFDRIVTLRPEEMYGYSGRSQALISLGRYEEAFKYNEELLQRLPSFRGFWELGRIGALNMLGRHCEALDLLNNLEPREIAPLHSYMYYLVLAETLTLLKRFDDALGALQKGMDETKAEDGCVPCFVDNCWRVSYLEPLRKPPYRARFEEIIGPKPKIQRKKA